MLRAPRLALILALSSGIVFAADGRPSAILADKPLSGRVVAYQIEARLDARKKTLDATETLTYRNLTGEPQDTFPFHLYLNAFQPESTFVTELKRDHPNFEWEEKYRAAVEIRSLEVNGFDLTSRIQFIANDDGNRDDRTVFQVKVPKPVPAGGSIQFRIRFHDQFGEVLARSGYKRDFIMGGQWFPKIGVWWQGAWNCHQYHSTTEFFADFGTFDVKLTVPKNEAVGASGIEVGSAENPDGTKTVSFHGEDIHDFAWTVQPDYRVFTDMFSGSMGDVRIRLLLQPAHAYQSQRQLGIVKKAMQRFDSWYGPYPYKQITVVDPPFGAFEAWGMEYPTLFTGGTAAWIPAGFRFPEQAIEHEFGHQYWYGMVATNEFENAWLDEGINSYTECKVLDDIFGRDRSGIDLWGLTESDADQQRNGYLGVADYDPMSRYAYQYVNDRSYAGIAYGKTATVLFTLENLIGEDTLRQALRTYFTRFRFTHPSQEDFLRTVEEVSGQNLRWFFDQAVYGTAAMDYEIARASSEPVNWYEQGRSAQKVATSLLRSIVLVHRKGDFIFPVDVVVTFDNGEVVRERWDGKDRWMRYTYDKKARVTSAEIDPADAVRLDRNFYNNSFAATPDPRAAGKITRYWTALVQFWGQFLAWFA